MKRILTVLIILTFVIFSSCEINLGEMINLKGPIVTITGPEPDRSLVPAQPDPLVDSVFLLTGTIGSPSRVARAEVKIDYWNGRNIVRMGREWKWDNVWQTREDGDSPWRQYDRSVYGVDDPDNKIKNPEWSIQDDKVIFSLPISMSRMDSGEYFITVSAWDQANLHDFESSKKIKIKYSNVAPKLVISSNYPKLHFTDGTNLAHPKAPSYDHLTFDPFGNPVKTNDNIKEFTNNFKGLSWKIERGKSLLDGDKLTLMITNEHNLDTKEGRIVYYLWDYDKAANGLLPQTGTHNNDGDPIPLIKLDTHLEPSLPRDKVTPLQLISVLEDANHNIEYKSNGWFFYLPDSDKPYPEITFATPVKAGETPPIDITEAKRMFRGTRDNSSRVYDDTGVQSVSYMIYRLKENSFDVDAQFGPVSPDNITPGLQRQNWNFIADRNWGVGRFKIVVKAIDTDGTHGDEYTAYFSIDSNSTPSLKEWTFNQNDTLWGDQNGLFRLSGKAQIECNDGCTSATNTGHSVAISSVIIVWKNPNDRSPDNATRYKTPGDPLWTDFTVNGSADDRGNKRFRVPAGNINFESVTRGNNNGNSQESWDFYLDLNWFNDLNIGQGTGKFKFEDQTFEARFTSSGNTALTGVAATPATALGDKDEPKLKVTSIDFNDKVSTKNIVLTDGILFPQIPEGAQIRINGEWSDDSIGRWTGLGNNRHQQLVKNFSVRWEGEAVKVNMQSPSLSLDTVVVQDGGTWTTGWYTFAALNTDPFVSIIATLNDLNDGQGRREQLLNIETDYPTLTRISSTAFDGRYGNHKQTYSDVPGSHYIDIYLDFNKPIEFLNGVNPSNTTTPRLNLDNGGRAFYESGDKSSRVTFRYFIDDVYSSLGTASSAPSVSTDNLNVTSVNFGSYPRTQWKSISSGDEVLFPDNILNGTDPRYSLKVQKKIVIDKEHPVILAGTSGINSSTSNSRPHGLGSQVRITVTFDEDIKVASTANASNLYLTLGDGLGNAGFDSAGARTINFMYTVAAGQNSAQMDVVNMFGNNLITDIAGNAVMSSKACPGNNDAAIIAHASTLGRDIKVETRAPAAPSISGISVNTTYYEDAKFTINTNPNSALNSTIQTVEYCLNHTGTASDEWLTYSDPITNNITNNIDIKINGTYNVAARVWDNATTQNQSPVSAVISNVKVDKGNILERITSSNPDGIYGHPDKTTIDIDVEFRIPVRLASASTAYQNVVLTMGNVSGATNRAVLTAAPANDLKKWTFRYTIDPNASTGSNRLSVTSIDFNSGASITDSNNTPIGTLIDFAHISSSNRFEVQKDIQILSGRPALAGTPPTGVLTPNTNAPTATNPMRFTANGAGLSMLFNRDIYRGNTTSKLIVRQIPDNFRIPAVLSSDRYTEIFQGRSDMFSQTGITFPTNLNNATAWAELGANLYVQGSNGATESGGKLTPDTTTKYVLRYDVDTNLLDTETVPGTSFTMLQIRTVFRAAEALSFGVNDPEVCITNVNVGTPATARPQRLEIHFSERSGLPVRGAMYEVVFPNGFVKDILGKANGGVGTATGTDAQKEAAPNGNDSNISSTGTATNSARILNLNTATEAPVIRIKKEEDAFTGYVGSNDGRNIKQPLTTAFRIDGRTPNSTFTYLTRQTTDNVYTLGNRNGNASAANNNNSGQATQGNSNMRLPNTGEGNSFANFELTRLRPQSGVNGVSTTSPVTGGNWESAGLNYFTAMVTNWTGTAATYSTPVTIGTDNYNDGGMEINIRAIAAANSTDSAYGYESAFRSVFVFNNQNGVLGGNADANNGTDGNFNNMSALSRIWIRGGNTTQGDPNIPNFPISRDPTKWKKVKLLSPIDGTLFTASNSEVKNDNVSQDNTDQRRRVWFWVTWGVNVTTFVDLHTGDLPAVGGTYNEYPAPRADIRQYFMAWVPSKEHYAVHPGRTTIVESRNKYGTFHDGGHGNLTLTGGKAPATPTDMN